MTFEHDARNVILGFEYQLLYGLYFLMDAKSDIQIYVEHYDDISINTENGNEFFQIKSTQSPKIITDSSLEFWKTLGNWWKLNRRLYVMAQYG